MPSLDKQKCSQDAPCDKCKLRKKLHRAKKRQENQDVAHRQDFIADLKKNYGLSLEDYMNLYVSQNGRCAICKEPENTFKRKLHVDHCHKTGTIRGLLCTRCNPGLGYFQDSLVLLEAACEYLKKSKKLEIKSSGDNKIS